MNYTFVTEDGTFDISYADYLNDADLMAKINNLDRVRLNLGLTIISYDPAWLKENSKSAALFADLKYMQDENPLQFFMPSAIDTTGTVDFLNDTDTDIKIVTAGNRRGKTATGVVDIILSAIPTAKNWPIFKKHGIEHRKFYKPLECGFATTDWTIAQRVLWPEIRKWIPKYELGEYDTSLPNYKDVSWRMNPRVKLQCGSVFYFFCYEQKQGVFEGQALNRWYWDEQGEEEKFNGADERLRTVKGKHTFGLTPHKVEGRPDTGARSWINKMVKDSAKTGRSGGHTVANFKIGVDDVPDWVYPESEKAKAFEKWVTIPLKENNIKNQKEGRSRYYGDWHDVGGLVYDEFDERYHLIDPFEIPAEWTRYRIVDHGSTNPTACLWAAVSPEGNIYLYREYYKGGLEIADNVRGIVEASGNSLKPQGLGRIGKGLFYERYEESFDHERYQKTIMDSRSKNTNNPLAQLESGKLYKWAGLNTQDAAGSTLETSIPIVKQLLAINPDKEHPHNAVNGSPAIFIFRNMSSLLNELYGYAWKEYKSSKAQAGGNPHETPVMKNDHLMDCLRMGCQIPFRYLEGIWCTNRDINVISEEEEEAYDQAREKRGFISHKDPVTGY